MPILAFALIFLNGSVKRIGSVGRSSVLVTVILAAVVGFFCWAGYIDVQTKLEKAREKATAAQTDGAAQKNVDQERRG